MKKYVAAIVLLLGLIAPALAQWQVPDHAVPIGRGPGFTGFKNAAPVTDGVLGSSSASADPAFTTSPIVTSITTPLIIGGTAASSSLTLESTSGAGTTDSIIFKTGSQATRWTINTGGRLIGGTDDGIGEVGTTLFKLNSDGAVFSASTSGSAGVSQPIVILRNNDTVSASGTGQGGSILYQGWNTTPALKDVVHLNGGIITRTPGLEDGALDLAVIRNGVNTVPFSIRNDLDALIPSVTDIWDIGQTTGRYKNLWLSGALDLTTPGTTTPTIGLNAAVANSLSLYTRGLETVRVTSDAGAGRWLQLNGSNGGAPMIATSAGDINLAPGGNSQVVVVNTPSTNRTVVLSGSNGANPSVSTTGGGLNLAPNNGHVPITGGTAPTLTAGCNGAGSVVTGTDAAGTITGQTAAATTCTLQFGTAYGSTPHCVASGQTSPLTGAFTPSTTTLIVNFASTANYKFSYVCFGS
jgi:hypothetical protein